MKNALFLCLSAVVTFSASLAAQSSSRMFNVSYDKFDHITAISLEEFLNVANAEKVEGGLEGTTFESSRENFTAVRALASEIGTTATKGKN